jgi:ribosomal protein S18 acetylase RimI-like enzyme
LSVRPLRADELTRAASTLALAFDEDPFFRHCLPSARSRGQWLRWFHRRALAECLSVDGAFTVHEGPEAGVIGVYPPGTWPLGLRARVAATPLPPFPFLPPHRMITIGLGVEARMHRQHPPGPHVYVYVLGVHPSQKGKGLGGALLRHAHSLAHGANALSHLETSKEENVSFYRRFGYEIAATIELRGAPPIWLMTTK